jgi:hypothetical protein
VISTGISTAVIASLDDYGAGSSLESPSTASSGAHCAYSPPDEPHLGGGGSAANLMGSRSRGYSSVSRIAAKPGKLLTSASKLLSRSHGATKSKGHTSPPRFGSPVDGAHSDGGVGTADDAPVVGRRRANTAAAAVGGGRPRASTDAPLPGRPLSPEAPKPAPWADDFDVGRHRRSHTEPGGIDSAAWADKAERSPNVDRRPSVVSGSI